MLDQRRKARATLASAAAKASRNPASPDLSEAVNQARRDYYATALEDYIRSVVAKAAPLTVDQRDRLAVLLRGGDVA